STGGSGTTGAANGNGKRSGGRASSPGSPGSGGGTATKTAKPSKNRLRQIEQTEAKIEQAEADLATLEEELAGPDAWATPEVTATNTRRHEAAKTQVTELYDRLEQLTA